MTSITITDELLGELPDAATDKFLGLLLHGMKICFVLSSSYRKNIENFKGSYVFRTVDDSICQAAIFDQGQMEIADSAPEQWDARVTFASVPAFQRFLFSSDHDILQSLLANEVEVEGNLNYIYKFGYMARELGQKLGVS